MADDFESGDNYTDFYESRRIEMPDPHPCDQQTHLYTYTHNTTLESLEHQGFSLVGVPFSNLVLVVIDALVPEGHKNGLLYPTFEEIVYGDDLECVRVKGEQMVRRNYMHCFNEVRAAVRTCSIQMYMLFQLSVPFRRKTS